MSKDGGEFKLYLGFSDEVCRHYFDRVSSVARYDHEDGDEEIVILFEAGGKIVIFTDRPLLWVEPERH